jgi:hypothetical protein
MPVAYRLKASTEMSFRGKTSEEKSVSRLAGTPAVLEEDAENLSSAKEFHAEQAGHFPSHFELSYPHCWHKNLVLSFFIIFNFYLTAFFGCVDACLDA